MKEINTYIRSDFYRYTGNMNKSLLYIYIYAVFVKNHCFSYSFWMRLSSRKHLFYVLCNIMLQGFSRKYGIQIPPTTRIGYGFYIGHGYGIIVNGTAIIGNNCNISQFTTIGSNAGKAAIIGDNCYIGPSVCIVENVIIGNNVTIGAGAVVVKDIPNNITVAGVPAKPISKKIPGRYIHNRWPLI